MITPLKIQEQYRFLKGYIKWALQGKPSPPPHIIKQAAIRNYQHRYNIELLVESGTFMGDMVNAQHLYFKKIISIELSKNLYEKAVNRFLNVKNIEILFGDSGEIIKTIVPQLKSPTLFWLDGHYSGGNTAKSNIDTPIVSELETIFKSNIDHVILIDDARLFNGENDYPTLNTLQEYITSKHYQLVVKNDIIRLTKNC